MTNVFLQAALQYAKRGWAVFPLVPRSKTPLTPDGFKSATTDEKLITEWWTKKPTANIGIATGARSGLVVLDFDEKHGGMKTFEEMAAELPNTCTVRTGGGGLHLYYSHPGFEVRNRAGLKPGMDVRGDGGYVVAPGSVHDSGKKYEFAENDGPEELAIQAMPSWVAQPSPPPRVKEEITRPHASGLQGARGELGKSTLKFILEGALPGTWHQEMFKACIDLKQQQYTFDEAIEKLESACITLDDTHDIPLLEDVYNNREVKHPPRFAEVLPSSPSELPSGSLVVTAFELAQDMSAFLSDKSKVKGESTGIEGLDKLLGGGYRTGEVTCWHAEAKTGKNTLWHKLMYLALQKGKSMGYASRELTPETEVLPNLLSLHYQKNVWLSDVDPGYGNVLKGWPLFFARGYGHFQLDDIKKWVDELQQRGVDTFWFDHLHYMIEDPEDHKAASKLIKDIKTLAKQQDINVQIIIQPNKLSDGQRLSLNSIKGGAAMGQAIDNLLILERVKDQKYITKLTLEVGRSKLCKPGSILLQYNPETTDFIEGEFEAPAPQPIIVPPRKNWGKEMELGYDSMS